MKEIFQKNIDSIMNKNKGKLDTFEIQLLCAEAIGKSREFVMAHPEKTLTNEQGTRINKYINRRLEGEPIAYILGHKEFYGLDFIVNKNTLVPRPETELLVDLALDELRNKLRNTTVIDVGTGSGNIIISIAHLLSCHPELVSGSKGSNLKQIEIPKRVRNDKVKFFGIDISKETLAVAKKNAKIHGIDKKIKFLQGDLLSPVLEKKYCSLFTDHCSLIITANLPYLSKEIYESAPRDVKNFEPKSALYSPSAGLGHYKKLLSQINNSLFIDHCSLIIFLEISPEQKPLLSPIIKKIFPEVKIKFHKDLAGKWRACEIKSQ